MFRITWHALFLIRFNACASCLVPVKPENCTVCAQYSSRAHFGTSRLIWATSRHWLHAYFVRICLHAQHHQHHIVLIGPYTCWSNIFSLTREDWKVASYISPGQHAGTTSFILCASKCASPHLVAHCVGRSGL